MADYRIHEHPILPVEERPEFEFYWQGRVMKAHAGETISSALLRCRRSKAPPWCGLSRPSR
jgi:hypothetical protein